MHIKPNSPTDNNYLATLLPLIMLFVCSIMPSIGYSAEQNNTQTIIQNFRSQHLNSSPIDQNIDELISDKQWVQKKLIKMAEIDQLVRTDIYQQIIQSCNEKDQNCSQAINNAELLMLEVDNKNLTVLKKFMEQYTWFKKSEFGEEASQAAWILAQHSCDADWQAKVLFILDHLVQIGEANPQHYAMLYDRISLDYAHFGFKQRYGSQFQLSDDRKQLIFAPCEGTIAEVDAKRKAIGLEPVMENAKQIAVMNNIEKIVGIE